MTDIASYDGSESSVPAPLALGGQITDEVLFVLPANASPDWKPIYDQSTNQIVGFYTMSQGIKRIYDIEGKFVTLSEQGLESSTIIEDIIFLFVGIGEIKYILRGGRELVVVAGRRVGRAAMYGMTAGVISESVVTGLRVAFRQLVTRQLFKFTATTAPEWLRPAGSFQSTFCKWPSNSVEDILIPKAWRERPCLFQKFSVCQKKVNSKNIP